MNEETADHISLSRAEVWELRDLLKAAEADRDRAWEFEHKMMLRATKAERELDAALDREAGTQDALDDMRADRDRLQERYHALAATIQGKTMFDVVAEKVDTEIRADRAARRVAELEAALIAVKHHPDTPEHIREYVTKALAGDGDGA